MCLCYIRNADGVWPAGALPGFGARARERAIPGLTSNSYRGHVAWPASDRRSRSHTQQDVRADWPTTAPGRAGRKTVRRPNRRLLLGAQATRHAAL